MTFGVDKLERFGYLTVKKFWSYNLLLVCGKKKLKTEATITRFDRSGQVNQLINAETEDT